MARKKQILALVLAASQLSAWRLASLASRSGIGAPCRLAQPVMAGGGFGASRSTPSLSADAARALDDAGGDLDAAQALHYQRALEALANSDPALHARLRGAYRAAAHSARAADSASGVGTPGISIEELHALHAEYLDRIMEQCFLLPKMRAVLGHLHTMLALALQFRASMERRCSQRSMLARAAGAARGAAPGG